MITKKQILEEYSKCFHDTTRIYMIENYLSTFDATQNSTVPLKLLPRQKIYVKNLSENINNIANKYRQAGISTVTCAYFACCIALADKDIPENILLIANNLDLSKENLIKIKDFLEQIPWWFWGDEYAPKDGEEPKPIFTKANEKYLILKNKSRVYARSAGPNASRGCSAISRILFDEAAFIETPETITSAISTTASSAKNVVYCSTPGGYDQIFHPVYTAAIKGENDFKASEFRWYQDPRYNKNLTWTRKDKETGEIDIIKEEIIDKAGNIEYNEDKWEELIKKGYLPSSTWYDNMCSRYNYDKKKIAQELDVSFLGSGGNVIDSEVIEFHTNNNKREPIYIDNFFKEAWIYREPIEGHKYIMCIDVSTGSGEDSSVIHILDTNYIDENGLPNIEQVFEYQGKIQGDILGELANKYGRYYGDALAVVDCIGSSGDACILKLQELNYKNLYYDDPNLKNVTTESNTNVYNEKLEKKVPGFRASSARMQMIMNLEKMLRFNEITPRSNRFMQELLTFIWKNGRPDHQSGYHDDTIMAMAMGLYVLQFSFKKLESVKEKNKIILNSMIMVQNAINNGITIENNSNEPKKVNKIPLPFYTSKSLGNSSMMNKIGNDKNKALDAMAFGLINF